MQTDKDDAIKRFLGEVTGQNRGKEPAPPAKIMTSIFGGVESFTGNVIFLGDVSPDALEAVLRRRAS